MQKSLDASFGALPQIAADVLDRLRVNRPAVHCITNNVAQAFTANILLSVGATPSMTISPDEIAAFVECCDALLVNLGTCDAERRKAIDMAVTAAQKTTSKPWVLDPVLIDRSPSRAAFARDLAGRGPAVVRLNHDEFRVLGGEGATPQTVEAYARDKALVVALSGASDLIADGTRRVTVSNGHPLMARVTAMGCAASALTAACLAVEPDTGRASAAALLIFGVAGEIAAETAHGPGSFAVAVIDALFNLDAATLRQRAKVM
jgi:hydroxyethylthiazole kinase